MKNIAIIIPPKKSGGVFQYSLSIADSLILYPNKFNIYLLSEDSETIEILNSLYGLNKVKIINISSKPIPLIKKIFHVLSLVLQSELFLAKKFYPELKRYNLDLFIIPTPINFPPPKLPYIASIPDIMHKYYPSLPDYGRKEIFRRNILYKFHSKKAKIAVVDSIQGMNDLNKFFKIPKEKIAIIPFIPPNYIFKHKNMSKIEANKILQKYNLPDSFIFYPAQFWYHKNHVRLVKALYLIKQKHNLEIPLVLAGSNTGNYEKRYNQVMNLAKKLNIQKQIISISHHLGKEIVALYKKSTAMVYPSILGPTNIPPIEAITLGTPVLCSNLFEMPKQVQGAGILFNPFNIEDIAEKIYIVWTNHKLKVDLIKKGREQSKKDIIENYVKQWGKAVAKALVIKNEIT